MTSTDGVVVDSLRATWQKEYPTEFEQARANPFEAIRQQRWQYGQTARYDPNKDAYVYTVAIGTETYLEHTSLLAAAIMAYLNHLDKQKERRPN